VISSMSSFSSSMGMSFHIEFINPPSCLAVVIGLATRHGSREANGVPRPVKVERRRQRQVGNPPGSRNLYLLALNWRGACSPGTRRGGRVTGLAFLGPGFFRRFGSSIGVVDGKKARFNRASLLFTWLTMREPGRTIGG